MPSYGIPGVTTTPRRALVVGACTVVVMLVLAVVAAGVRLADDDDGLRIVLHTSRLGDGVLAGTVVRLDGVAVGRVAEIAPAELGTQLITLRLDPHRLPGVDSSLRVDFATGNLFGISEIQLRRGAGGAALRPGMVLELTDDDAVYDATMGNLLRNLSQVSDSVLTPQMGTLLATLAADTRAFAPFFESVVTLARTFTEVQQQPLSLIVGRFGTTLGGGGNLIDAILDVLDRLYRIDTLRNDRDLVNAGISMVVEQLFPTVERALGLAGESFAGYTDLAVPVLDVLAQMVPAPQRSSAELRELIDRLGAAMPDSPDGPVLQAEVDLSGVPALAVPLLGTSMIPGGTR
ncbi:MCE family protein [Nocardia cyriacigeorgica]|uniref:MlaD family protein n=1 Tax=Nocardia cyriacigeorgica TaxID=135487 RepID=UPI001893D6BB|nr:MlaD family protein [Nocardia cyriacigeorgica]MBF6082842.1 MCE family protein [Nocardia cyriacigeorgica]